MDFLDEDAKPRFVLQSKSPDQSSGGSGAGTGEFSKPILAVTIVLSSSLIIVSLFFLHSEPWKSLLLWLSLSLLLGPLAPPSLTAGDIRVGRGPALNFPSPAAVAAEHSAPPSEKKPRSSRSHRRPEEPAPATETPDPISKPPRSAPRKEEEDNEVWEEKEWVEEEIEVLKKQLVKNPAGKPGRWESIAENFRGRHGVESVIRKAKELGERKSDADSYSEFLRRRKPSEKKALAEHDVTEPDHPEMAWSSGEDIALLNALKAFPKEAAMRWEKVAAALPGRSKAECVKRVSDLKKGFRDSKKNSSD